MADAEVEPTDDLRLDVRAVLAEIGAEEAVAQLELRLEEFDQQLARLEQRNEEAERARKGELDVMRARVSDALQVVQDAVEEQRAAWEHLETRLAALASETEAGASAAVEALRDELTPRVHRALLQADEVQARLAGEVEALGSELRGRLEGTREQLTESANRTEQRYEQLEAALREEREQRTAVAAELDGRTRARIDELAGTVEQQHGEVVQRLDALRRELDATTGELRAGWNLRAQELEDALAQAHDGLAEAIEEQGEAAAELERRWIEGTRDIARRIEEVANRSRELAGDERVAREDVVQQVRRELDELVGSVHGLQDSLGASETRRVTDTEQLRRTLQETGGRLDVLQQKVANAVGKIASELTTRVASVTGELEALRETSVRQEQRLVALDTLGQRLDALESGHASLAETVGRSADDARVAELTKAVSALRQDLSTLAGGVEASVDQSSSVRQQLTVIQETLREHAALRQEVRELAAKVAESGSRLDETERLARAAGQAIAGAVRKARQAAAGSAAGTPLAPRDPSGPTVPAAEREPLFQERPQVQRRGEVPERLVPPPNVPSAQPDPEGRA